MELDTFRNLTVRIFLVDSIRLKDVIRSCQQHKIVSAMGEEIIDINLIITCLRDLFEHLADDRHASGVNVPLR